MFQQVTMKSRSAQSILHKAWEKKSIATKKPRKWPRGETFLSRYRLNSLQNCSPMPTNSFYTPRRRERHLNTMEQDRLVATRVHAKVDNFIGRISSGGVSSSGQYILNSKRSIDDQPDTMQQESGESNVAALKKIVPVRSGTINQRREQQIVFSYVDTRSWQILPYKACVTRSPCPRVPRDRATGKWVIPLIAKRTTEKGAEGGEWKSAAGLSCWVATRVYRNRCRSSFQR